MESEPGSGSQIKKGRSHRPSDHSPSQSLGVTINAVPHKIVVDILSKLPTPSLFRAQFVCRSWRALARDPLFLELHQPLPRLPLRPPLQSPLYFVDDVFNGDGRNRPTRKFYPPFCDVVGSIEGLLCLENALYSDIYVYNPLTGEYRELPDSEGHQRNREMVFGFRFDKIEKDYKVMKIMYTIINRNGQLNRVLLCCSKVQVYSLRSPM